MTDQPKKNPVWLAIKPFLNGGASGMAATCVIQPIDMVKVRLQLGDKGSPVSGVALEQCIEPGLKLKGAIGRPQRDSPSREPQVSLRRRRRDGRHPGPGPETFAAAPLSHNQPP